jgi:hypothetical protein
MKRLNHSSETLRASAQFVVLCLAAEQISSSRFSTLFFAVILLSASSCPRAVLSSALRRTASAHVHALPSLH